MHFLVWSCTFLKSWTVGRYFVLNFCMPTVFDIIPIELVRFRNTESSFSFSFPAILFLLSRSYSNIKVENNRGVFRPFPIEFILSALYRKDRVSQSGPDAGHVVTGSWGPMSSQWLP